MVIELKRGDILLCDLDAFFAAVEQLDNPELRGKPVIVGGSPDGRGVVSTCSYEARAYGVRSAMPMFMAKKLCPHGIYLPVNMKRYQEMSRQVLAIYYRFTPLIEIVSIDEAYLEVNQGTGMEVAQSIRQAVKQELGLTVSIGVSSNKLLAKISSNLAKPDGCISIWPDEAPEKLGNHSIRLLPGIGPKTGEKLKSFGIETISQLSAYPREWFIHQFGSRGEELFNYAHWQDDRPLILDRERKSIGREETLPEDITDEKQILSLLNSLSSEVGYRLRKSGNLARTLTIKIRYADFKTVTRSCTSEDLFYTDQEIFSAAKNLYLSLKNHAPIRLVGIQVSNFEHGRQLSLFDDRKEKEIKLAKLVDQLNDKYGKGTIKRTSLLSP